MPRESWRSRYRMITPPDDKEKKSSLRTEPDTRSGSSERPRTAEPEAEPRHEDAREHGTESQEEEGAFTNLYARLSESPHVNGMNDTEKRKLKMKLKELIREWKYDFQGYDYKRVKAITDAGKPTPWRTNTKWNSIKKPYQDAWRDLRTWALVNHVWDEKDGKQDLEQPDEKEFIKETGGRMWTRTETAKETARNVGLNIAVGGLYGVGYALIAPWKMFELGLKYASQRTGDDVYLEGMMEKMFRKDREKAGSKGKEEKKPTHAQEYETKIKVKEMEIKYLHEGMEIELTLLKESPEYLAASAEERAKLIGEKIKEYRNRKEYNKALIDNRIYWISQEAWRIEDEENFRGEKGVAFDSQDENSQLKYMLTPQEFNDLRNLERRVTNRENQTNTQEIERAERAKDATEDALEKMQEELAELQENLNEIKNDPNKEAEIKKLNNEIENIDHKIKKKSTPEIAIKEDEQKIEGIKKELAKIINDPDKKAEIREFNRKIKELDREIKELNREMKERDREIEKRNSRISDEDIRKTLIKEDSQKIGEIKNKAKERSANVALWPLFSKNTKESPEQALLTVQPTPTNE